MIRAGTYKIGKHEVTIKDLAGGRQAISIDGSEALFNDGGYQIDTAPEAPPAESQAEVLGTQKPGRRF